MDTSTHLQESTVKYLADHGIKIDPVPHNGGTVYNLTGSIEDQGLSAEDIEALVSNLASGINPYQNRPQYLV